MQRNDVVDSLHMGQRDALKIQVGHITISFKFFHLFNQATTTCLPRDGSVLWVLWDQIQMPWQDLCGLYPISAHFSNWVALKHEPYKIPCGACETIDDWAPPPEFLTQQVSMVPKYQHFQQVPYSCWCYLSKDCLESTCPSITSYHGQLQLPVSLSTSHPPLAHRRPPHYLNFQVPYHTMPLLSPDLYSWFLLYLEHIPFLTSSGSPLFLFEHPV